MKRVIVSSVDSDGVVRVPEDVDKAWLEYQGAKKMHRQSKYHTKEQNAENRRVVNKYKKEYQDAVKKKDCVNCSTRSYTYKGYRIYDTGNGYNVYKDGKLQSDTEFISEDEAEEFIDGLEDAVSGTSVMCSEEDGYWYLFRHGSGPGTIPKDVQLLESKDHPTNKWKFYGKLDRMLTTDELQYYDLKEEMPE